MWNKAWPAALLVAVLMAGCTGLFGGEDEDRGPWTAKQAIDRATPVAQDWRDGARVVAAHAHERGPGAPDRSLVGVGPVVPVDDAVGDGIAAVWLVGFRDPADQAFLLVAVHDGGPTILEDGDSHHFATLPTLLGNWQTSAKDAVLAARAQDPALDAILDEEDVELDVQLRPADPTRGFGDNPLGLHAHWMIVGHSTGLGQVALAYVDATNGQFVTDGAPSSGPETTVDWHIGWGLFVDGERIDFSDDAYQVAATQHQEAHLRPGSGDQIIHVEGIFRGEPLVTLRSFLGSLDVEFQPGYLRLDNKTAAHGGRDFPDGGGKIWRVYVSERSSEHEGGRTPFEQASGDFGGLILQDGQRILITYGSPDQINDQVLQQQQSQVPEPTP